MLTADALSCSVPVTNCGKTKADRQTAAESAAEISLFVIHFLLNASGSFFLDNSTVSVWIQ
jgi:hypothetical protein